MKNSDKTWLEVSAADLRANATGLKRVAGSAALMAVVKSNAYGHGTATVVKALAKQADWFAVDSVKEADEVRAAGAKQPVLVLGYTLRDLMPHAVSRGYSLTIYHGESVAALAKIATPKRPAKVHLKIETGTSRQGARPEDLESLVRNIRRAKNIVIEGVSTHFANIEDTTDHSYAARQLSRFILTLRKLEGLGVRPEVVHTACSAAAILFPDTHFNAVRSGIAIYGLWPSGETKVSARALDRDLELRPALTWKTVVAQVKPLPKGTPVSYGLTEKVERDSRVAVLPVGYWDGLDRKLSSVGYALVRGRRAKILGRVCMNMCVIDVTDIPNVQVEDEVVLLGRQGRETITAEEIAKKIGTINYEVVTRINPTLPRRLVA